MNNRSRKQKTSLRLGLICDDRRVHPDRLSATVDHVILRKLNTYTEAVISLIAPRPVLFMAGDEDIGSPHAIEGKVKDRYKLYGSEKLFGSVVSPGLGHVYVPEMWEKMLNWIDGNLREAK